MAATSEIVWSQQKWQLCEMTVVLWQNHCDTVVPMVQELPLIRPRQGPIFHEYLKITHSLQAKVSIKIKLLRVFKHLCSGLSKCSPVIHSLLF